MRIAAAAALLLACVGGATVSLLRAVDAVNAGGAESSAGGAATEWHRPAPGWLHRQRRTQAAVLTSRGDKPTFAQWIPIE